MKNIFLIVILLLVGATAYLQPVKKSNVDMPTDKNATKQTINLYKNLKKIREKGFMVGHQDALAYGVNWKYEPGRSDIKDVTGDNPAVFGWELGHLEIGATMNLDSVPFDKMRHFIQDSYQKGSVITISWHGNNPMTGKTAWDPEQGTVESILPNGPKNADFNAQLDKVADFFLSLKGSKGELVPILFRPFHEHTGGWFWWGNRITKDETYKALFRYTVSYLQQKRNVHNLLYVYNTGTEFSNEQDYLKRYPGDDVVDMFSFDTYQGGNAEVDNSYTKSLDMRLGILEKLANDRNKIATIGETGYSKIPYALWFTKSLLPALEKHKFSYVLFWRNAGFKSKENSSEFYVPYKGHSSEEDFVNFYKLPNTLFQSDLTYSEMYE